MLRGVTVKYTPTSFNTLTNRTFHNTSSFTRALQHHDLVHNIQSVRRYAAAAKAGGAGAGGGGAKAGGAGGAKAAAGGKAAAPKAKKKGPEIVFKDDGKTYLSKAWNGEVVEVARRPVITKKDKMSM